MVQFGTLNLPPDDLDDEYFLSLLIRRKYQRCAFCRGPLPFFARLDARYCSPKCRQAAYRKRRLARKS